MDHTRGIGFDTFCPGLFSALFTALAGHHSTGPCGHETTTFTRCPRLYRQIDNVSPMALEQLFKNLAGFGLKAGSERAARQQKRSTAFYFIEFGNEEVSHIPQHEVVLSHHRDEFFADGLVLFRSGMERMGKYFAVE